MALIGDGKGDLCLQRDHQALLKAEVRGTCPVSHGGFGGVHTPLKMAVVGVDIRMGSCQDPVDWSSKRAGGVV